MFRSLIINTAISTIAYVIISIIGLITVPVLINAYGLTLYGLITLARLWMPTGILGLLDLGVGETASLSIAHARATEEWEKASGAIAWLGTVALMIGIVAGLILYLSAEILSRKLSVPSLQIYEFATVLKLTAVALPLLFISLVAEGVLKGFEEYSIARAIEVVTSLTYGIGSIIIVWLDKNYIHVAYWVVIAGLIRACISLITARKFLYRSPIRITSTLQGKGRECWQRMRTMALNKVLSTLQVQAAPTLIGVLVGPAGLGIYDVLVRLPRFAKSIFGLINSALLPFAARLEAGKKIADLRSLGKVGLPLVAAMTIPPMMAAATASKPILLLWIGPEFVDLWFWQSMMFLVPGMTVLVNFGATALFTRKKVADQMNLLLAVQLIVQVLISLALIQHFQERAFIIGQVVAIGITFYWQMRLIFKEQEFGKNVLGQMALVIAVGLLLSVASFSFVSNLTSIWQLGAATLGFIAAFWLMIWWLLPNRETRNQIILHIKSFKCRSL